MNLRKTSIVVAVVHLLLVLSLGVKLVADRATRPRVWVRALPVDPSAPIRGRYVSVAVEANADASLVFSPSQSAYSGGKPYIAPVPARLSSDGTRLVAVPFRNPSSVHVLPLESGTPGSVRIVERLAYYIPEHVPDPSRRSPGEELWVEVTVPRRGLPRPIRLGIKKNGVLTPLDELARR